MKPTDIGRASTHACNAMLNMQNSAALRYKQEVYDLAMQRKAQTERGAEEGYVLPTSYDEPSARSGRYEAAMQRYKEPDAEGEGGNPYAEQVCVCVFIAQHHHHHHHQKYLGPPNAPLLSMSSCSCVCTGQLSNHKQSFVSK